MAIILFIYLFILCNFLLVFLILCVCVEQKKKSIAQKKEK